MADQPLSLEEWEKKAALATSLTLVEMRRLYAQCPDPHRPAAAALWRLIVAMVHTRRGPNDLPSDWTLRSLDQDQMMPVH
jgi:hypothetical protein